MELNCHVYPRLIMCQTFKQSMHIPNLYFSAAHHNSTNLFYSHLLAMNSSCSIHSEFQCGNGECIDYQLTCDGIAHCKDRSDEKMQYCGKNPIRQGAVFEPSGLISKLNEGSYRRSSCSPVTRANKCNECEWCDRLTAALSLSPSVFTFSSRVSNEAVALR